MDISSGVNRALAAPFDNKLIHDVALSLYLHER